MVILGPLDFLDEFTRHIPPKGAYLILYDGWCSQKALGMRRKASTRGCDADGPTPSIPLTNYVLMVEFTISASNQISHPFPIRK
jgi:hypothetical protein